MFADWLSVGEFFSSHWSVVLGVGLAFFVVQIVLSVRIALRARRHNRMLVRLRRDLARGGDGRNIAGSLPEGFPWLRWVLSIFPAGTATPPGNYTRDEVLQELDTRIASDSDYLLLQRMGVMAPLLGVVLTVVGFYWLKVGQSDEQSLQSILLAVTPLISGVGAGAVLALVNQALLHGAGVRIERLRMSARAWFDAVIWSHAGLDTQAATVKAVAAIERFARTVAESADRHAASSAQIEASTASMKSAASGFHDVAHSFGGEIKGMPQTLAVLRDAMAASANALKELIPVGARAVANLDVSVAAFRTTIDREFTDAAKLHYRSSKVLAQSVEQIGDSTELLKSGSEEMKQSAEANSASLKNIDLSLRQHLEGETTRSMSAVTTALKAMLHQCTQIAREAAATQETLAEAAKGLADAGQLVRRTMESDTAPSQRTMHNAAASFARSAAQLSEFIQHGLGPATRQLATLHQTLVGLEGTVDSIKSFSQAREDIDRLTETLARAAEIADAISSLPEQMREMLKHNSGLHARANSRGGFRTWLGGRPR